MSRWFACFPLVLFILLGCQKKETGDVTQQEAVEKEAEAKTKTIEVEDLGFASRLPKSVEFYASVHHPTEIIKAMMLTDGAEFLFTTEDEEDEEEADTDEESVVTTDDGQIEQIEKNEDTKRLKQEDLDEMMAKLDEVMIDNAFICIDRGMATNVKTAGRIYQDTSAAQANLIAKILARLLKMENPLLAAEDAVIQAIFEEAMNDGFSGVKEAIENGEEVFAVPCVYLGCKPPEGKIEERRQLWLSSIGGIAEEQEGIEKCEFKKYGAQFQGVKLTLAKLLTDAAEAGGKELQKELDDQLGDDAGGLLDDEAQGVLSDQAREWFDLLNQRLEKLTMMLVVGEVDGHLVMFFGENEEALKLVDQPEDSLAGRPEFAQLGKDGGKLIGTWYASEELIQSFQTWRGYEKSYRALGRAFDQEKLPNSDKIVKRFNALAELEHQLTDCKMDDYLMLCTWGQGVKFDSVGGRNDLDLDYAQPLKLPAVADAVQEEYFIRAHWRGNQSRQAMRMDYAEEVVGVIGQVVEGGYLAFLERSDEGAEWYEKGEEMYEEIVAPEVARFWGGYRKLCHQALDGEVAVMVDLQGGMPRVPQVPKSFISEGKLPRMIVAQPVKDREALSSAYADFELTATNVLDYTSILVDTELPMPDFLSADKGDLTTWFYPFPMMTDDFVPGVSVCDSLLMVGTSKNWSEQTYACWEKRDTSTGAQGGLYGSVIEIQFKPLWDFVDHWLDLAEQEELRNAEELEKGQAEDEKANAVATPDENADDEDDPFDYAKARKILNRTRSMKSIHWHRRKEQGKMRSTLEFKMGA